MKNRFQTLLQELGERLDLDLISDTRQACTLLYQKKLFVQMEIDAYEKYLLLATRIVELPPGKFRENVLLSALQYNNLFPLQASLGYSSKYNALTLSACLPLEGMTGKNFFSFLAYFISVADKWKKAIDSGQTAPLEWQQKKP